MGVAHLYNAVRVTKDLKSLWTDMETTVLLCDQRRVFLGSRPQDPVTFRKRYILTTGISLRAFASNKPGCDHDQTSAKHVWAGCGRRRRLLSVDSPCSSSIFKMAVKSNSLECYCSEMQDVINPRDVKGVRAQLPPSGYLKQLTRTIDSEVPKLLFNFLRMDFPCQSLVRMLHSKVGKELKSDLDFHPSIIYDLMYASRYTCGGCKRENGDPTLFPRVADILKRTIGLTGKSVTDTLSDDIEARFSNRRDRIIL